MSGDNPNRESLRRMSFPRSDTPRGRVLHVRLTDEEYARLVARADQERRTLSESARMRLLEDDENRPKASRNPFLTPVEVVHSTAS